MARLLYAGIGGFGAGVLWRSLFDFGISFSLLFCVIGVAIGVLYGAVRRPVVVLLCISILSFGSGMLRYDIAAQYRGSAILDARIGEAIVAEGVVIDEPDRRENSTRYTVLVDALAGERVSDRVLVVAESHPTFSYGDRVSLRGTLRNPEGFVTDTDRYFDYPAYLATDGIFYEMIFPDIVGISSGHGNPLKRSLFALKRAFLSKTARLIPDPQASLLGGLIVGAKQSLGEKLQQDFRTTGIVHIVVLSGYNITIVADAIMRAFSFLPKAAGLSLGALSIVFFAVMTGASATIVRASIMALLVLVARATGRQYEITRALCIAGFIMVLHNPRILVFDASFQLSFLATLGLIWLSPLIEQKLSRVSPRFQIREVMTATIATQLFVLPLLLYKVGELSLVALPVNLLILMTVPATMLLGFITGVVGFASATLAAPFSYGAYILLSYQLAVVEAFSRIPFASIHLPFFPLSLMLALYALYALFLWRRYTKEVQSPAPAAV